MKTSPTKSQISKWTKVLRSGNYSQAKNALQNDNGFCCLGVACKVFISEKKIIKYTDFTDTMRGEDPRDQYNSPKWLKNINRDFRDKTTMLLSQLNDAGITSDNETVFENINIPPFTFDEIADLLEAVYIHEVLK